MSISIFWIWTFFLTSNINNFSFFVSNWVISLVRGCSVVGILSCFLKAWISAFYLFFISSASLMLLGSYPILITKSFRALVLVSLAKYDIHSIFFYECMLLKESCSFEVAMDKIYNVEYIISLACLWKSIWLIAWTLFVSIENIEAL